MNKISVAEINLLPRQAFVEKFRGVFEHSSWIAESIVDRRPFSSLEDLHEEMCRVVQNAPLERKLELIRAHPDLAGRAAAHARLTRESQGEQQSAGLGTMSNAEADALEKMNAQYRRRFGFPFVICARLNKKETILEGLKKRLTNEAEGERETAVGEIFKIAHLRLQDLVES